MRGIDGAGAAPHEDESGQPVGLGPPGWAEFAAARERFMQTLTVEGLEAAWTAPAHEPARRGVGSP